LTAYVAAAAGGLVEVAQVFLALRPVSSGDGQSLTAPTSNPGLATPVGSAVKMGLQQGPRTVPRLAGRRPADRETLTVKP
jgi:hypothetical protein